MFHELSFDHRNIDVSEEVFYSVLQEFVDVSKVVALCDDDGVYYYHSWSTQNVFTFIGCSSEYYCDLINS